MNRRRIAAVVVGLALILAVPLAESTLYTVNERELAVVLQFGEPVASRTKPGLSLKLPLVQEVLRLPKTLQVWHGTAQDEKLVDVPTADGKKVEVTGCDVFTFRGDKIAVKNSYLKSRTR